jgi:zinc protease
MIDTMNRTSCPVLSGARPIVLGLALLLAASATAAGQAGASASVADAPLSARVPDDPRITVGTLPNGLRYYIRANAEPRNRAELRLVVNAGSALEDDDQRGLAHFVEHMAFNGTTHFPGGRVVQFLQSIGMRFGAHVNAHTSFDETVYQLQVPTTDLAALDRSFLALEDWAQGVSFDPGEVDKERGVITEERRLGLGADVRFQDVLFPLLFAGSRYAERSPIGLPEIIQTSTPARLRRFYTDWYRPDLMAVIAVGDFDPPVIEGLIRSHFAPIPAAVSPRARPMFDVPGHADTRYSVVTDPEAGGTTVSVYSTLPPGDQTTVGGYRRLVLNGMVRDMLSARLDEIAQQPDAPFLAAGTGRGLFVRSTQVTSLQARVADTEVARGLGALFAELERAARFGFTVTELAREKLGLNRFYQRAATEATSTDSARLADEYIRNFTQQEPIPGIAYEYAAHRRFLPEITLAEINDVVKQWIPERSRVVAVSAPASAGAAMPDTRRLAAVVDAARTARLTPYVDNVSSAPLLDPLPTPGRITNVSTREALGITEWELSNGVRVVLKPTTFKQNEILFRAISPGGSSLAADPDFVAAQTAATVISGGGLGMFSQTDLEKLLAGKDAFVQPRIGEMFEGLDGGTSREDLETMFQLVYLTFTEPRPDPEAFRALTDRLKTSVANRQTDPDVAFGDTLRAILSQDSPRARPMSPAMVDQMSLDKSLAFYDDRFADASDFTFVIVGSFDPPTIRPLVERYLASLPALHRQEAGRDTGVRPPPGIVEQEVVKGVDPKSRVAVVFSGPFENDPRNRVVARAMAEMLAGELQQTLREDLGGTYGVSVQPEFQETPVGSYQLTIDFSCDPARTDALTRALFTVIERFRRLGPSARQIAQQRLTLARDDEVNSRDNRYLLNQLLYRYQYGEDVADVFNMRQFYDQLTVEAAREAAGAYLDPSRYVKVTLRPEAR